MEVPLSIRASSWRPSTDAQSRSLEKVKGLLGLGTFGGCLRCQFMRNAAATIAAAATNNIVTKRDTILFLFHKTLDIHPAAVFTNLMTSLAAPNVSSVNFLTSLGAQV